MMLVKVDRMMFLHLSRFLNFYSALLSWLLQHVELLLDLINGIIGHRIGGIHSNLQHNNVEILPSCCPLFLTPSDLWTRCISELRHCWTVWYRLRGLWAYLCWNEHITLICFGKHFSNIVILNLIFAMQIIYQNHLKFSPWAGKLIHFKFHLNSIFRRLLFSDDEK